MIKIKTAQGWRAIVTKNVIAPIETPPQVLRGWREAGYKSFRGWILNDRDLLDVENIRYGLSLAE